MAKSELDATDAKILGFVERYVEDNLMAPTLQEIADDVGMSKVGLWERVRRLVGRGYLLQEPRQARSIRPGPMLRSG